MPCVPSTPATGSLIVRGASGVVTAASNAPAFRGRKWGEEESWGGGGFECIWNVEPVSIAENFAVTVRDMTVALIEEQYELLARASAAPLELPPALPQPNAHDFPTSQKRKMTGHEAAIQEEIDAAVRRREAIEAGAEYNDRHHYTEQAVRDIIERHSQRQEPLSSPPPATSFLLLPHLRPRLLCPPPLGTASPPTNLGLGEVSGGHKS